MVLINKSRDVKVARRSYGKFKEAVQKHLPITLMPLGTVFMHENASSPLISPFILQNHQSDVARCIENIAQHLVEKKAEDLAVTAFFSQFLKQLKLPFQLSGIEKKNRQAAPDAKEAKGAASLSRIEDILQDNVRIHDILNRLLGRMDTIAEVLNEIKEMLSEQKKSSAIPALPAEPSGVNKPLEPIRIPLDFDAYLKQRVGN